MGIFNSKPKQQIKNINGYIIDELTGMLIDVPKGLQVYTIPREVKKLKPQLDLATNSVLTNMKDAQEIIFEDGSIDMIPDGFFTFSSKCFTNLKKVTLPNGIKSLGDRCIDAHRTQYTLPLTLEHLGTDMYPEVQRLVINGNIKTLGGVFASHDLNLRYVEVAGSIRVLPNNFVNQCKNINTLILHEGVEIAEHYAFRNLNGLQYVELPESFKMPFETSMEARAGSVARGNAKYDGSNGVYENQKNQTLTIKKTMKGIPFIFQVRRGDFSSIQFQNNTAVIRSTDGKIINVDLSKSNTESMWQIDFKESRVQQVVTSQQQFQKQTQIHPNSQSEQYRPAPVQNRPIHEQISKPQPIIPKPIERQEQQYTPQFTATNGFNEDQMIDEFQKIYKMKVIPLPEFQLLSSEEKIALKKALFQKCESLVKKNNSLSVIENSISYNLHSVFSTVKRNADATVPDFEQTQQHPEIPRNESIDDIYKRRYDYEKMPSSEKLDFDRKLDDYKKRKSIENARIDELKKQKKESLGQKRGLIEEQIRLEELNALNFANIMIQQQRIVIENEEEKENEEEHGMSM